MALHIDRTNYWKSLATAHVLLLHSTSQKSFIRMNDDELDAAVFQNAHRNVVIYAGLKGMYEQGSDEPERVLYTTLYFYTKAASTLATDTDAAKDTAMGIMEDFVARIFADANGEVGDCPITMDIDNISFNEADTWGNNFHGWQLSISEKPQDNVVEFDAARWNDL